MDEVQVARMHARLQRYLARFGLGSDFVEVNGAQIHHVCFGQGEPLVLVHGFGSFLYTWRHNIVALASRYQVFAIDLPGFGLSTEPAGFVKGLTNFADFLASFFKNMNIDQAPIIGHSFGGAVCLDLCRRRPNLVRTMVLVASSVPGEVISSSKVLQNLLLFKYFDKSPITPEVIEVIELMSKREQPQDLQGMLMTTSFDSEETLKVPTLIVWGESDLIIPVKTVFKIAKFLEAPQQHIFSNCGHAPHEERPEEFNDLTLGFLEMAS